MKNEAISHAMEEIAEFVDKEYKVSPLIKENRLGNIKKILHTATTDETSLFIRYYILKNNFLGYDLVKLSYPTGYISFDVYFKASTQSYSLFPKRFCIDSFQLQIPFQ